MTHTSLGTTNMKDNYVLGHFSLVVVLHSATRVNFPLRPCWGWHPSCKWDVPDLPPPTSRLPILSVFILVVLCSVLTLFSRLQDWLCQSAGSSKIALHHCLILCHTKDDGSHFLVPAFLCCYSITSTPCPPLSRGSDWRTKVLDTWWKVRIQLADASALPPFPQDNCI